MRYICPRCGEAYTLKPANGTCRICDAALVAESEAHEAEQREGEGLPAPKRKL